MSCRDTLQRLDAFVDGRLSAAERRDVREHLDRCLKCSRELAALRHLEGRAADLPGVAPRRDLWPEIRERIAHAETDREPLTDTPIAAPSGGRAWRLAAAAAVLALALVLPRWGDRPHRATSAGTAPSPRALLAETLEQRRSRLPAESVEAFESNLAILDGAIREIEGALEASPENRRLRLLLAERRQQEAELLKLLARA